MTLPSIRRLIVCSVFLFGIEAPARTIRVPADYSSIQAAIDAGTNGDLVLVSPGTYNEAINFSGKAITLASSFYETGNPTNILNTIISPPAFFSGVSATSGESTNSKLIGFTITGCSGLNSAAVRCYEGSLFVSNCRMVTNNCRAVIMYQSRSVLRACEIRADPAYQYDAIHSAQSAATIEGNFIFALKPGGGREAIYHSITAAATNLQTVIRSNTIYGPIDAEFHEGGPTHLISYNLIVGGMMITGGDPGLQIINNSLIGGDFNVQHEATPRFANNIIAFGYSGLSILGNGAPPEISYNTIWACERPELVMPYLTNGNVLANPWFKDSTNGDYTLLPGSQCIDSGDPLATPDPDGTPRDRGAYYFDQTYQGWLERHFSTTVLADTNAQQTIWGPNADPDLDLSPNLYEYFSGCDPLNVDSSLQRLQLNLVGTNSVLTFRKSKRLVGITSELQHADILPIWNPAPASAEPPLSDLGDAFIFQTKVSNVGHDQQFFRMKVRLLP